MAIAPSSTEAGNAAEMPMTNAYRSLMQAGSTSSMPEAEGFVLARDSTSDYAIEFEYSNSAFGEAEIANYSQAFQDGRLAATVEATDVQDISANQARARVKVLHFAEDGQVLYEGIVFFSQRIAGERDLENRGFRC